MTYFLLKKQFPDSNFPMLGYMVVLRHHGDLENPETEAIVEEDEVEILKKQINQINEVNWSNLMQNLLGYGLPINIPLSFLNEWINSFQTFMREERRKWRKNSSLETYFITNLLFSLLIDADKSEVVIQPPFPSRHQEISPQIIDDYRESFRSYQ